MSEAWKGDEEQPAAGGLFAGLFGRPLTPEQRAEVERRTTEMLAKGNAMYATLPGFRPHQACVKCGHAKAATIYCPGSARGRMRECAEQVGEHEHLHRQCKRCGYAWCERTLSEEAS